MKIFSTIVFVGFTCGMLSCREKRPVDRMTDAELKKYAMDLAHHNIIIDGHVDLPDRIMENQSRLSGEYPGLLIHSSEGDFDFDRAKKGGLDAPFMSIYVPSIYQQRSDRGKSYADTLINLVKAMPIQLPDQFALANSPEEVRRNARDGKISLPMGMENGAPIGDDLKNVQYFFERGIRYITLTHRRYNQICGSSGDTTDYHQGLSPFGRAVVKEMNRVGIMVDISHVDDSTFYQVMKLTKVPCIASHSSCKYFAPTVKRDMTDDMIRELGENGGVVLINFYTGFLDSTANQQSKKMEALLEQKGLKLSDSLARPFINQLKKDYPVDIEMVANHIDHVVKLIGVDHVGFGSDFDGVGGFLPTDLEDVSKYPNLIYVLLKRGYTDEELEKICGGNAMRVWQQVLDAAHH